MKRLFTYILVIIFSQSLSSQDIDPRNFNYQKIDSLILSCKPNKFTSPEKLAKFINTSFKTKHEKLRAIFKWVTNNIVYSYNTSTDPEDVFKTRKAICQGYSELVKYICDLTEIQCLIIDGTAKNYLDYLDNPTDTSDHAWNMVTLYDKKYLLDATWAAGYRDVESNEFVTEFAGEYYLTIPEVFVLQHLPRISEYQLLDRKISKAEFCKAPVFNYGAMKTELVSFYPPSAKFDAIKMTKTDFSFEIKKQINDLDIRIVTNREQIYGETEPVDFIQTGNKITFYWEFENSGLVYMIIYIDKEAAIYYKVNVIEH